ncbi:MAG: hypothetical protein Q8K55_03535 [Gemmatimonadaceae bacterium]|nr:hypothetical protein [Gemmatimonadaceae bacterium]
MVESALAIAEADGFIEHAEGRWRVTEFGDQALAESDDVALMEAAITEHLRRVGLAARDELAVGVGCVDSAEPSFLDALERALAAGNVEWLGPATYGLPAEQLAAMDLPDEEAGASRSRRDLKDLVIELGREVNELRVAVAHARGKAESYVADASSRRHGGGHGRSRKLAAKAVAAGVRRYADHRAPSGQAGALPTSRAEQGDGTDTGTERERAARGSDGERNTQRQETGSHAMPAVCDVGRCGVAAIGRCFRCNLAFCTTHQGRDSIGRTKYTDICSTCMASEHGSKAAEEAARRAASEPSMLTSVVEAMNDAGVGGLETRRFRWEATTTVTRPFRTPKEQITTHEFMAADAWPIGPLDWKEYPTHKSDGEVIPRQCGVTVRGAIVLMPGAIAAAGTRGSTAPVFDWVKRGYVTEAILDTDLLSVQAPSERYKASFTPAYPMTQVGRAVGGLDTIARRHGLDLAHELGWSSGIEDAVRRYYS